MHLRIEYIQAFKLDKKRGLEIGKTPNNWEYQLCSDFVPRDDHESTWISRINWPFPKRSIIVCEPKTTQNLV